MSNLLHILSLICVISSSECARILAVFPFPSISHQVVFRSLMQELAKRGHEVVVITADPAFPKGQSPENLTEIDVHDVSYKIWNDFLETGVGQNRMTPETTKAILDVIAKFFEAQAKSDVVQKLIKEETKSFDLLFVESCVRLALGFGYLYNVPIIEFSSLGAIFGTFDGSGVPTNYLVYPLPMRERVYNLTLWEKISAIYSDYNIEMVNKEQEKTENKILKGIFGSTIPGITELKKKVQMIFLNIHPIWDFNRPVSPNIIYLGGIHQKPDKELPKDIKTYLDSSKNGLIYMSFGTNARPSLLSAEKLRIFTNVFSQLPYNVLWKWDKDELPGIPENVKISKWLPQSDLLKHPNVKLFITQGGIQSTDEALTAGVPLIVIPFLGDQWFNSEQYVKLNIGIRFNLESITEANLKDAIETIIQNKSYRENVRKVRALMRDQPQPPLERAVWWTEHALRHGGATHLRPAAAHMHWTEYYALDVVTAVAAASIVALAAIVSIVLYAIKKLQVENLKIKMKIK